MRSPFRAAIVAMTSAAFGAAGASATTITIDFEGLNHGAVVDTQFVGNGVTISADSAMDLAVAFDSRERGTRDPDLEGPNGADGSWSDGNLAPDTVLGLILIIQENDDGCSDWICDLPDDEGSRPAGELIFEFSTDILSFGFDLVDVEGAPIENGAVEFYSGGSISPVASVPFSSFVDSSSSFFDPTVRFGNNTANTIAPIDAAALGLNAADAAFDKIVIKMGGSAGVDNISFLPAPEPDTLSLVGIGLGVFGAMRTRRPRR